MHSTTNRHRWYKWKPPIVHSPLILALFLVYQLLSVPKVTLIHIVICKTNSSTLVMKIVPNAHRQTSSLTLNSQSVRRVKFLSTKHWNAFVLSSSSSGKAAYTLTASTSSTRDDKDCGSLDTECTKLEAMQRKQAKSRASRRETTLLVLLKVGTNSFLEPHLLFSLYKLVIIKLQCAVLPQQQKLDLVCTLSGMA